MPRKPSESAARPDKPLPAARARASKTASNEASSAAPEHPTPTSSPRTVERTSPEERIATLAYLKWMGRGCPVGDDKRDWFEAEQEVKRETEPA